MKESTMAPCIYLEGHTLVQKHGSWYMTPYELYLRMIGSKKIYIGSHTLYWISCCYNK